MKIIYLYGQESSEELTKDSLILINEAVENSANPTDHKVFGDGNKSILQLLKEDKVKKALEAADEDTLVIIDGHGLSLELNGQRIAHYLENEETNYILKKLPKSVKYIKFDSCFSGSLFRVNVKEIKDPDIAEIESMKDKVIKNRLIFTSTNSKDSSLVVDDMLQNIKFIQNSSILTAKQTIITAALSSPLSHYLSYDNPNIPDQLPQIIKLPRLFRGLNLEDIQPGSIEQIMDNFIDQRVKEVLEIFPEEEAFIKRIITDEKEYLKKELIQKSPYLYANRGNLNVLKMLEKSGANMKAPDNQGFTPLFYSSFNERMKLEIIEFFLNLKDEENKKIINPNLKEPNGSILFSRVDEFNNPEIIKFILENEKNLDKNSKFLISCNKNYKNIANFLLKDPEVDPNVQNNLGLTAIMYIYLNNKNDIEAIKPFVEDYVTDLNIQANDGTNLLMSVCSWGSKDVAKYLLNCAKVIDLTLKNNQGDTAISLARKYGFNDIAEMVLRKLEKDLFQACKLGDAKMVAEILSTEEIDVNLKDSKGFSPLYYASCNANSSGKITRSFLNYTDKNGKKIDPNSPDPNGKTILERAFDNDNKNIFEIVVENEKIDPNAVNNSRITVLMYACQKGQKEIILDLLAKSVDTNRETSEGKTALDFACENGHFECVSELFKAGAKLPNEEKRVKLLDSIFDITAKKQIEGIFIKQAEKDKFGQKIPSPIASEIYFETLKKEEKQEKTVV